MKTITFILVSIITNYHHLLVSGDLITDKRQYFTKNHQSIKKLGPIPNFKNVYTLGDSYSDNGNFYKLFNYMEPKNELYYKGRMSNGPVWVEHLSRMLDANLTNLAYAGATTDEDVYKAPFIPEEIDIPGCVQQAQQLNRELPSNFDSNSSLVTVAFIGNDFLRSALPGNYIQNMKRCFKVLMANKKFRHVMVATSLAPEVMPASKKLSLLINLYANKVFKIIPDAYRDLLTELRRTYPETKFYNLDVARNDMNEPIKFDSCLNSTKLADLIPAETTICTDPNVRMFWDSLHPTTHFHEAIAIEAIKVMRN